MSRARITEAEQRSLVALRAAYTNASRRFDAMPHLTKASRAIAVSKLADLTDRIERLERKGGAK